VGGAVFMLIYLRACAGADRDLMSSRVRRRVHSFQRRAPSVVVASSVLAGVGLVPGLLDGLT